MKCKELTAHKADVTIPVYGTITDAEVYLKDKADEAIAELMKEISNLKAKNIELQSFYDLHGNVDNYIDKLKAENTELKQKLENVQASMYADVVDANMENRRLKRALYIVLARLFCCMRELAARNALYDDECKWDNFKTKCLKKAEEYK